jgi:hypothetical protein
MAHRSPDSPLWDLAARSRAAWERLIRGNPDLGEIMEWQVRGWQDRSVLSSCPGGVWGPGCLLPALTACELVCGLPCCLWALQLTLALCHACTCPRRAAQTTGSLLLATTAAEMTQLEARASMLQAKGVEGVRLLVRDQVVREEPALGLPPTAAGLLVESDAQIVSLGLGGLEGCWAVTGPALYMTFSKRWPGTGPQTTMH